MEKLLELANICLDNKIFYGVSKLQNIALNRYWNDYKDNRDIINNIIIGEYSQKTFSKFHEILADSPLIDENLPHSGNISKEIFAGIQINFEELPCISIFYNQHISFSVSKSLTITVGIFNRKVNIKYNRNKISFTYHISQGVSKIEITEEEYNALHQKYIDNCERLRNEQSISLVEERIEKYKTS